MNLRVVLTIVGVIVFLVIMGGVGYKIVAPSNKTVIEKGGRQVVVNTESPKVPLGGCAIWRLTNKLYWESGYNLKDKKEAKK